MLHNIKVGQILKHYKGNLYKVLMITTDTETLAQRVIYQRISEESFETYGEIWDRPIKMFFDKVNSRTTPNTLADRFTLYKDIEKGE